MSFNFLRIFALYLTPVFIHVRSFQTCYADLVRKVISSAILIRLWDNNKYVRITLSFFTTSSAEEEGRLFSLLLPIAFKTSGSVILYILGFSERGGMMVSLVKPSRSSLREHAWTQLQNRAEITLSVCRDKRNGVSFSRVHTLKKKILD